MDVTTLFFLSSGLFLGWSLGANDAANVFGTAVGSRMIRFPTAVVICGLFVIVGAVVGGAGPAQGLCKLGAVNALPGSFTVALAAALTVYWMTRFGLPVSVTQAIVGAIVGWNIFSSSITDMNALLRIVGTWVACPILGALFASVLYRLVTLIIRRTKVHLLWLDLYTRVGLILAGAFGAYALGANNIANVMGVFVSSSPFQNIDVFGVYVLSPTEQLFMLGGIAIAVGVFYSRRVMMTVGRSIMPVNPVAAWVVVVTQGLVLFIFSSAALRHRLIDLGLPPLPLVPVSSSQAVVGAVIGIGLSYGARGLRQIKWGVLGSIASGWVSTPILAATVCYIMLFFLQNVFQQQVYREVQYELTTPGLRRLEKAGVPVDALADLTNRRVARSVPFRDAVRTRVRLPRSQENLVVATAEIFETELDPKKTKALDPAILGPGQIGAVVGLAGKPFRHRWELADALARAHPSWKPKPENRRNRLFNARLKERLEYVFRTFHTEEPKPISRPADAPHRR